MIAWLGPWTLQKVYENMELKDTFILVQTGFEMHHSAFIIHTSYAFLKTPVVLNTTTVCRVY